MQKNGIMTPCECCGKLVYVIKARKNTFKFCSKTCFGKVRLKELRKLVKPLKGKDNPRWKGGTIRKSDGYKLISVDGKQNYEHRIVMEKHLKRKLKAGENVHHINGNRTDNRIENLELNGRSEHTIKYHKNKKNTERYKKCLNCNKIFYQMQLKQKFCSHDCGYKYRKMYGYYRTAELSEVKIGKH